MSTQPTTPPVGLGAAGVISMDVTNTVALIAQYNANSIATYQQSVSNWLEERNQTTAIPPPAPITIQQVNQAALQAAYVAFNNFLAGVSNTPVFISDRTTAITNVPYPPDPRIAAALTAPTPPAQPTDPVGADLGNGMYAVLPGDTNPAGFVETDSRGTFVKIESSLAGMGESVGYKKIS